MPRYFILHKPPDTVSTALDHGHGRTTVYDVVKENGFPTDLGLVGRLDYETTGLILFTDDSVLNRGICNAAYRANERQGVKAIIKVYHATVKGHVVEGDKKIDTMREPLFYEKGTKSEGEGFYTKPAGIKVIDHFEATGDKRSPHGTNLRTVVEVSIGEGKNRQIRRLCYKSQLPLMLLHRVQIDCISLQDLAEGSCRYLEHEEVVQLYKSTFPDVEPPSKDTMGIPVIHDTPKVILKKEDS